MGPRYDWCLERKKMAINQDKIKEHILGILEALGDDINRPGIIETPDRVAKMYAEVFEGMNYTNQEIATMFDKTFEEDALTQYRDLVIVKDIECFSYCEHHLALMYNMKVTVAYLPSGKVLGLSKIARVVDMAARRLQLQERLGHDISEILSIMTGSQDVAVFIEASHSCMTARGIQKPSAITKTQTLRGEFNRDSTLLQRTFL